MLIITTEAGHEITAHVGQSLDVFSPRIVAEISVDGDELEAVKSSYPHLIPQNGCRVVRIFGDNARMVVANCFC